MSAKSTIPNRCSGLTPEDMRAFVLDQEISQNLLELDLAWSEPEIEEAMDRCRMMWDAVPPAVDSLRLGGSRLPREHVFQLGTAYQMYLSKLQNIMRNDIEYTIGGVQARIVGAQIKHFKEILKLLRDEFMGLASARKETLNLQGAYGTVG